MIFKSIIQLRCIIFCSFAVISLAFMFDSVSTMICCSIALLVLDIIEYLNKQNTNHFNTKHSINGEPRNEVQL
jgi:hypothetical protein